MHLDAAERWALQQCAAGGVAAPATLGSRKLRAEALRRLTWLAGPWFFDAANRGGLRALPPMRCSAPTSRRWSC